ncbi:MULTISPECIES: hypothetical protein [Bizionia]|uniref:Type II secretion system protein GspG C-terminal domain-containing protein n=1 Tax=Bizionia algoritergicola TaxID=291187 RepID=A0A5D0QN69_9FLAO|nr:MULTISPECIES: hypothetical protein [Bizionia]OBX22402.1 hypothetical protein BAA08_09070 [Bizionia sp. APA-3]TYB70620.1 hypothetical protein ES675_15725 [Bizionia algoritergicola]
MLDVIGELLFWREDSKFAKRKKARREFEKENHLPKKLMIHPVWQLFGIFMLLVLIAKLVIGHFFFSDYGTKKTTEKIAKIELILENEKKSIGIYPEKLNIIIRNNPLRKNITSDYWNNEFIYEQIEDGIGYLLISKGKDGILKTEDDIYGIKNVSQ